VSCPDLLHLSQLLDGELAPADAASVLPHVDTCAACRARLERLERATAAAGAMAARRPAAIDPPGAECVAPERLAGWTARALPAHDLRAVEAHLERCDVCLDEALAAVRLMARLDAGPTLPVPPALAARVAAAPSKESLTALVLRVARAGVELIERHAAPLIVVEELPLALAAVRAGERAETVSVRIQAPEAQIRATFVAEGAAVGLTLTLLGNADDALAGQRVILRRQGRSLYSARTDDAGVVRMPRIEPGVYEVSCPGIATSFRLDLRQ
jgi:predicted anti-sigma-YlaC factor YlaD